MDRIEHQQRLIAAPRSKAFGWDTVTSLPHIARVMNRNVETNLDFDEALAWPPSDKSRTRPDDRLPAQRNAEDLAERGRGPRAGPGGQRSHPGAIPLLGSSGMPASWGEIAPELRVVRARIVTLRP